MNTNRFLLTSPKQLAPENSNEIEKKIDSKMQSLEIDSKSLSVIKKEEENSAREKEERMKEKFILPIIVFMKIKTNKDNFAREFLYNLKEYSKKKQELIHVANLREKMIEKKFLKMIKNIEKYQKRKHFYTLISTMQDQLVVYHVQIQSYF